MKTFIIKTLANGIGTAGRVAFDPVTGKQYTERSGTLTAKEISDYKAMLPQLKQELYNAIKPMLARGGFLFDPTLWKWQFEQFSPSHFGLWVIITFVDDYDSPKAEFMQWIKQTGIMNYDFQIVKPYG